jgi:ribosomal protein S18 acetylase RimI-like enzyme
MEPSSVCVASHTAGRARILYAASSGVHQAFHLRGIGRELARIIREHLSASG